MYVHALGLRLCKTAGEIEAMPYAEFIEWLAYFDMTAKA